jgi:hypothetical protein
MRAIKISSKLLALKAMSKSRWVNIGMPGFSFIL